MPTDRHDDRDDCRRDSSSRPRSDKHRRRDKDEDRDGQRKRDREDDKGDHKRSKRREQDHSDRDESDRKSKRRETSADCQKSQSKTKESSSITRKTERQALRDEEDRRLAAEWSIYSATDNPFHDTNLSSKFNWTKKREKEKSQGITVEEANRRDQIRKVEAQEELEKLNLRRGEREKDMELRELENQRMSQLAENAQMASWIAREDEFQLEQVQRRAEIRVREHRAKPIDVLALNLKWGNPDGVVVKPIGFGDSIDDEEDDGAGLEVDLDEPYTILDHLSLEETQELLQDIQMHLALEKQERNVEFWQCLKVVADDAIQLLSSSNHRSGSMQNSHNAIKSDVNKLLAGKPIETLIQLQTSIENKLASSGPHDPEYWQGMLAEVKVWKAKAKLRSMHEVVLRNRLEQLRRKQRDEALRVQLELATTLDVSDSRNRAGPSTGDDVEDDEEVAEDEPKKVEEVIMEEYSRDMSPVPLTRIHGDDHHLQVLLATDEWASLVTARQKVLQSRFVPKPKLVQDDSNQTSNTIPGTSGGGLEQVIDRDALAEQLYKQEAEKGMDEEEELFDMEAEMGRQSYTWEDKYRPRKPRYFNKVHTGYEWNKYNQTHYDTDNPPPKVVQGYKFNIFYPDLIDKTKAPTYKVIKRKDNQDIVTLLFTAGPPYEDIAFTIVNKQWEHSHKRGFKSTFDRGVLQLHFTLARIHYRK